MTGDSASHPIGALAANRPNRLAARRVVLFLIAAAGVASILSLDLTWSNLWPDADRWGKIGDFLAAAFTPALDYEGNVPEGTNPLLLKVFYAAVTTLIFAVAATSLSVVIGAVLAFGGSTAWWADDPAGAAGPIRTFLRRTVRPVCYALTRVLIACTRSTHELIWAVLFVAALGRLNNVAAVLAIVIPYSGTLAKVFSEMIDEAPRDAAHAMRHAGAASLQTFIFGLMPRALPDMIAYAIYRFECALRSAAVLGFFGVTTLGGYLHTSFENLQFHETWTYLYALIILVVLVDFWSRAVRRRLTG